MTKRREKKNVEVERRDLYVQSAYCGRLDGEDVGRKEWTTQWLAVASKVVKNKEGRQRREKWQQFAGSLLR